MPGGKPAMELPGETPTLPVMTLAPVLVTVEPPRTAKLCEVPSETWADAGEEANSNTAIPMMARGPRDRRFICTLLFSFMSLLLRCRCKTIRKAIHKAGSSGHAFLRVDVGELEAEEKDLRRPIRPKEDHDDRSRGAERRADGGLSKIDAEGEFADDEEDCGDGCAEAHVAPRHPCQITEDGGKKRREH